MLAARKDRGTANEPVAQEDACSPQTCGRKVGRPAPPCAPDRQRQRERHRHNGFSTPHTFAGKPATRATAAGAPTTRARLLEVGGRSKSWRWVGAGLTFFWGGSLFVFAGYALHFSHIIRLDRQRAKTHWRGGGGGSGGGAERTALPPALCTQSCIALTLGESSINGTMVALLLAQASAKKARRKAGAAPFMDCKDHNRRPRRYVSGSSPHGPKSLGSAETGVAVQLVPHCKRKALLDVGRLN